MIEKIMSSLFNVIQTALQDTFYDYNISGRLDRGNNQIVITIGYRKFIISIEEGMS
jgi:hypothetical protein